MKFIQGEWMVLLGRVNWASGPHTRSVVELPARLFKHRLLGLILRVPDSVGLGGAQEFAFLTSSQVLLMLLV